MPATALLLDTQAFLRAIYAPEKLTRRLRTLLGNKDQVRIVSVVSLWEIAVKSQIGKLPPPPEPGFYQRHIALLRASVLPVNLSHSMAVFELPLHHKGPFDRLLIAQARVERLTVATSDSEFPAYGVKTVW